jgi:hypothetical protein
MGYDIALVRSPPRSIRWSELAAAARGAGWEVDDATREVRLTENGRLAARVMHGDGNAPWSKLTGRTELAHLIALADALGARARGDDFESYRTPDDSYVHPDDVAACATARAIAAGVSPRRPQGTPRAIARLGLLLLCGVTFLLVVAKD